MMAATKETVWAERMDTILVAMRAATKEAAFLSSWALLMVA